MAIGPPQDVSDGLAVDSEDCCISVVGVFGERPLMVRLASHSSVRQMGRSAQKLHVGNIIDFSSNSLKNVSIERYLPVGPKQPNLEFLGKA